MIGTSVLFLLGLGLVSAVILAVASKVLYVREDPRIRLVEMALAGANCGGCGYPGCRPAAEAVVAGKAGANVCVIGGRSSAEGVAAVMGLEVVEEEPRVSFHDCQGGFRAGEKFLYEGAADCRAQAVLFDGSKNCPYGCLSLGTCVRACPFDALSMGPRDVPLVDREKCVACGICAEVCPRGVFSIVDNSARITHLNTDWECLAPCRQICPAEINIPLYIELARKGRYAEALLAIKERMPMPLTIGRVCPMPCEEYCRRGVVDSPVAINQIKRSLADWEMNSGTRLCIPIAPETGKKVAVIGGGPAGISCAYFLRRLGHSPTIFESQPELGGQLRYGIPEYRLPKKILDWEIEGILALGIEARTEAMFGRDYTIASLQEEGFEAFFMGMGAWLSWTLGVEGEDAKGVRSGTEFLTEVALGREVEVGQKVAVVGGGNTAIDAARTARRMGAEVTIMYRRTEAEMPANALEIHAAKEEGIRIMILAGPTRVVTDSQNCVAGLEYVEMELGDPDASGRRRPVPKEGSEKVHPCDMILTSIGQYPDTCYVEEWSDACEITRRKTLAVNPDTMQTSVPGVFAAGDLVTGPSLVVTAIGGGRKAARGIHYYLMQGEIPVPENLLRAPVPESLFEEVVGVTEAERCGMPEICADDHICDFREVEHTLPEEVFLEETRRCMRCGTTCTDTDETVRKLEEMETRKR